MKKSDLLRCIQSIPKNMRYLIRKNYLSANRRLALTGLAVLTSTGPFVQNALAADSETQTKVELAVAALPSAVPRDAMGSSEAGISNLGLIHPEDGTWLSLGLIVPKLKRSRSVSWDTAKPVVIYRGVETPSTTEAGDETSGSAVEKRYRNPNSEKIGMTPVAEVARTQLPEGNGPFLLLLGPGTGNYEYRIWTIPDGSETLPSGSIRLINATSSPLACLIGQTQTMLQSKDQGLVRVDLEKAGMVDIKFAAFDESRGEMFETWSSSILMSPNERILMFIFSGSDTRVHQSPLLLRGF